MRTLVLGNSSIFRRRVRPALVSLGVDAIDMASRTRGEQPPDGLPGRAFGDYREALHASDAELVYVSTANSQHAELVEAALQSGRHVVVDKPAATSLAEVEGLVALAQGRGRLLAEATVFAYHPQFEAARRLFEEGGCAPSRLVAVFSFPPLPPENFRHRADAGGGVLWDLGPYAVSSGRIVFGEAPSEILARRQIGPDDEVEAAFDVIATYGEGRSLVGHFGTTTTYLNRLELLSLETAVTLEPAFTTPRDQSVQVQVRRGNQRSSIDVAAADSFALFLSAVFAAVREGGSAPRPFGEAMLADARALDRLRASAVPA
jgi:dTDP-3,4-didehydro-2,6-dideoxy-alpha-D-glucose 3-reductase